MSIKLIVSDIDGTILPRGGEISDRTRAAVRACAEHGVTFAICSGRWIVSALPIIDALEQKDGYMILSSGGAVAKVDGTVLQQWTMTSGEARGIYEVMKKYDVMRIACIPNAIYRVNTGALSRKLRGLHGYLGQCEIVDDDAEVFERKGLVNPYKMEAYADDAETLARLAREAEQLGFITTSACQDNLEIMPAGHGKGVAVRWLAERLGLTKDECMGFGDNTNDMSMLKAVGWPVAMENAVDELKVAARLIAPRCEEDGVAQVIEKVLRGEIG